LLVTVMKIVCCEMSLKVCEVFLLFFYLSVGTLVVPLHLQCPSAVSQKERPQRKGNSNRYSTWQCCHVSFCHTCEYPYIRHRLSLHSILLMTTSTFCFPYQNVYFHNTFRRSKFLPMPDAELLRE
jgi:hypothetical protein